MATYFVELPEKFVIGAPCIQAFWCVFNNLPPCDKLNERESYHLMRGEHRRPVWYGTRLVPQHFHPGVCLCIREDADNADGGLWVIKVEKQQTVSLSS